MVLEQPQRPERRLSSRVGVFGGSFDPIHMGHLIIAEEARTRLRLDQVIFVPARISPHKLDYRCSEASDRLAMARLAVADNLDFSVSTVDVDRKGPSFTVDMLQILRAELGETCQLFFIMGMDSLQTMPHWRKPDEIIRLARIVVVTRPGYQVDVEALDGGIPGIAGATDVLESIQVGISSTDLRQRVALGQSIRYQVPAAVESYIREHGLYEECGGKGDW